MTAPQRQRGNRQRLRGVVVREKAHKTITVEVTRRFQHPRYGKMVRRHTRLAAHDPSDEARTGDTVEIVACRPLSKMKRYRLVRIIERGPGAPLVGQPPARPESEKPEKPKPAAPAETPAATEEAEPQAAAAAAEPAQTDAAADVADEAPPAEGATDEDTPGDAESPAT
jgi:small subunit ribosomal protein S17